MDECDIDSAKRYPLRTRIRGEQVCIGENSETIYNNNNDILTKSLQPGEIKKTRSRSVRNHFGSATTLGPQPHWVHQLKKPILPHNPIRMR